MVWTLSEDCNFGMFFDDPFICYGNRRVIEEVRRIEFIA